jgi:hypothetical protein
LWRRHRVVDRCTSSQALLPAAQQPRLACTKAIARGQRATPAVARSGKRAGTCRRTARTGIHRQQAGVDRAVQVVQRERSDDAMDLRTARIAAAAATCASSGHVSDR